jgi:hypothetical protein
VRAIQNERLFLTSQLSERGGGLYSQFRIEFRIERKTQDALAGAFSAGECAFGEAQRSESRLQMQGAGIVNDGTDSLRFERGTDGIAAVEIDDELVIGAFIARIVVWPFDARAGESLEVDANECLPLRHPSIQVSKLDA